MDFDLLKINPYIRVAFQSVLPAGGEIKRRIIFDYELLLVERGTFVLNYDGRDYPCIEGQFVLIRPGIPHSFSKIQSDLAQPHIHFDMVYTDDSPCVPVSFKDYCDLTPQERKMIRQDIFSGYPTIPYLSFSDREQATELFYAVVRGGGEPALTRKAKLLKLIDMLIRDNYPDCLSAQSSKFNIARQLKDFIDAGQGMSAQLQDFEKQFSYSKYYLERQFKENYGISLMAYRNQMRMRKARELLEREGVSTVSERLGFSSVYVFSRAFRQHYGVCPTKLKGKSFEEQETDPVFWTESVI